jgi:uroporphyrinogen decarboxylase
MADAMSHIERVTAALRREAVDRPPMSFWRHFYRQELTVEGLVEAMIHWQRTYDWDFVKLNARASYHVEDWGNRYLRSDDDARTHRLDWYRVREADEWRRLEVLKPTEGVLGEHLRAIRLVKAAVGPDVPVIQTVFTPLAIAGELAGRVQSMRQHLENRFREVQAGLERITEVFTAFASECLSAGASGLFFATTQWATADTLTAKQYREWARPYDLRVLAAVREAPFNVLHVCGPRNLLKSLLDYPVQAFNWDAADATNPGLAEVRTLAKGAVMGGITQAKVADEQAGEALAAEVDAARAATGGTGWFLTAGCVLPTNALDGHLRTIKEEAARPMVDR